MSRPPNFIVTDFTSHPDLPPGPSQYPPLPKPRSLSSTPPPLPLEPFGTHSLRLTAWDTPNVSELLRPGEIVRLVNVEIKYYQTKEGVEGQRYIDGAVRFKGDRSRIVKLVGEDDPLRMALLRSVTSSPSPVLNLYAV